MEQLRILTASRSREIEDSKSVRTTVFQQEQGISRELDFDSDESAVHFVAYLGTNPIGAARFRYLDLAKRTVKIERVAVLKEHRDKKVGKNIMNWIEGELRARQVEKATLHSQETAKGFYEKLGYEQEGEAFEEAGIPHVNMVKPLI